MQDQEEKDRKNRKVAWISTIAAQLIMLLLFYFIVAWRAPFPPIPEYGIELGFETSGGAQASNEMEQEVVNENESETPGETSEPATSNEEQIAETPSEQPEPQVEEIQEESQAIVEEQESVTDPAVEESNLDDESDSESEEVVETDQSSETSEKEEEPEIDERAIYGSQGEESTGTNSEGASLALSGWIWDFKPRPDDQSSETGKIVYQIVVDQDGYLVKIETVTSTVSPTVERQYRQAVEKLTFSKTSDYQPAPLSTGTLTFIIKSK